ncbi:nucleotide modification associated domain-containing protein, partial [Blattabacterium cuenoti]|uniref:nucleotide modification associated domain-containing protein n=1 Tax=Blattabacterium cuenoti TaxID=1653831 RepID=UPI00311EC187
MNNNKNIDTIVQYDMILKKCKFFFKKKLIENSKIGKKKDINNIIFLKIKKNKWIDVINLSIIAIFFYKNNIINMKMLLIKKNIYNYYDLYTKKAKFLMIKKNFDYEEAWKIMELSSMKDIILQKFFHKNFLC